jgi:pilus assembly protein CpaE
LSRRREGGQAAVELVALLPMLAGVALAVAQLLAAGVAHELAGHAAEAGALALVQEEDPVRAARSALPGWSRDRVSVAVSGRRVQVRLRPVEVFPGAAGLLTSVARADAGPPVGVPTRPFTGSVLPDIARSRDDPHGSP